MPFVFHPLFWVLVVVLILQALWIIRLKRKSRSALLSFTNGDDAPSLQKTKQQLYREIARHEATEELLRETQEYMNCMINSMPTVLIGITPDGYVTHWNHSAEKAASLLAEEAIGSHIAQAFPDLSIGLDTVAETIKSGIPYIQENIKDGVGSQATFTNLTIYPLVSADINGAVILAEDVTPRVRMENLLIQNEKMMSLGELAAGMAHEINNPLAGILSNAQNIDRRTSPNLPANIKVAEDLGISMDAITRYLQQREIPAFLDDIRDSGERAAKIVTNLLEFSRGNDRDHSQTNLAELIDHSLDLAKKTFELETGSGVELPKIRKQYDADIGPVYCSATEIQQVLLNLLRNAAQAMKSEEYGPPLDPEISIRLYRDEDYTVIQVTDNGPGMSEEVQRHIFEPFFTTKEIGKGTGLGLSVSYFIVKEHHQGVLEAESKPGEGTTFRIKLPIY